MQCLAVQGYALLNCDDHKNIHKKYGRDPGESRPDILHQVRAACVTGGPAQWPVSCLCLCLHNGAMVLWLMARRGMARRGVA